MFQKTNERILRLRAWWRGFWQRVSGGLAVSELWSQFTSEARAGYRLYSRDVSAAGGDEVPVRNFKTGFARARAFFWAILMKLRPSRRVMMLIALVLILFPNISVRNDNGQVETTSFTFLGALMILLVLVLETADRVVMKRDLEIAREIQLWLVPTVVPELPGLDVAWMNRPQNTVAGDYYDVFVRHTLADNSGSRVLLVIADVAGKSIPAGLLMATFQASLKTLCATPCTLMELAKGLNSYACAYSKGGQKFTTAFLAEYDPSTGDLEYINAGHNPPLLRGASGQVEKLEAGGLPFGIFASAKFEAGRTTLAPGDLLLIYTDGLIEAVNAKDEEFDESRTISWLMSEGRAPEASAKAALDRLTAQLNSFVGMAVQHDDITTLLVRRIVS